MKNKTVSIIIANFNGKHLIENCLNSIKKNTSYKNYKVIVVDNGSTDGSQNLIKSKFKWVDLLENKTNRGFSGGNNDGAKYAIKKYNPDYLYSLSNDTLVEGDWISEVIKTAQRHPDAGIVGSKQLNFERKPVISAGWIKRFGVEYYFGNEEKEVNWVSGAGFLIKKEVIQKIGFFDEIYNPAYYEETDLEKRAIIAGFKIIHCPKSFFLHKGGQTTKNNSKYFSDLFYRNRFIYFMRHYGFIYFFPRIFHDVINEFRIKGFKGVIKLFKLYRQGYVLLKERRLSNK